MALWWRFGAGVGGRRRVKRVERLPSTLRRPPGALPADTLRRRQVWVVMASVLGVLAAHGWWPWSTAVEASTADQARWPVQPTDTLVSEGTMLERRHLYPDAMWELDPPWEPLRNPRWSELTRELTPDAIVPDELDGTSSEVVDVDPNMWAQAQHLRFESDREPMSAKSIDLMRVLGQSAPAGNIQPVQDRRVLSLAAGTGSHTRVYHSLRVGAVFRGGVSRPVGVSNMRHRYGRGRLQKGSVIERLGSSHSQRPLVARVERAQLDLGPPLGPTRGWRRGGRRDDDDTATDAPQTAGCRFRAHPGILELALAAARGAAARGAGATRSGVCEAGPGAGHAPGYRRGDVGARTATPARRHAALPQRGGVPFHPHGTGRTAAPRIRLDLREPHRLGQHRTGVQSAAGRGGYCGQGATAGHRRAHRAGFLHRAHPGQPLDASAVGPAHRPGGGHRRVRQPPVRGDRLPP
eukprot:ctg_70.g35